MPQLFHQQALQQQTDRLHGEVLLLPQFSHSLLSGLLLLWLIAAVYWLVNNTYARKETVSGWLEPLTGVTRIYAESNGIIKKVLVKDNDIVAEDQPLAIINGDHILADGTHLEAVLLSEYQKKRTLLTNQLNRAKDIYAQKSGDITQRIDAAKEDLQLIKRQSETLNKRHSLVFGQVKRYRSLNKSRHVSRSDLETVIANELQLRSEEQSLSRSQVNQRNRIQQLQTEEKLLPGEYANGVDNLRAQLSDIAQQIAQLHGKRSYIIRASRAGIVSNLQAREGQRAKIGTPLLSLVPVESTLIAHLLIPVRSIGFVESGQRLDIRYDAFPYQKFGLYSGKVTTISDALLLPNELLNTPVAVQEPVYRVSAKLLSAHVQAYGRDFPLKPGMTLSADVRLADRTLFQWLLEPLYSLKGRL